MDWRTVRSNHECLDQNNQSLNNKPIGKNQSQNADKNIPFDFKTKQSEHSYNPDKLQWKRKQKSANEQEQRNTQGSNNRQKRYRNKQDSNTNNNQWENKQNLQIKHSDINTYENKDKQVNENKTNLHFGYKHLEELCNKSPSEIIFVINNRRNGFIDLFKQNKEPDWIFLLMQISAKFCFSEFNENKIFLLTELTCNTFLEHIKKYILSSPTEKNSNRCKNMNAFFENCLVVFQSITTLFPKTAVERLKDIILSSNIALTGIKSYCKYIQIDKTTIDGMSELLQKLNDTVLTEELEMKEKIAVDSCDQFMLPPNNFRELTVYPTTDDLEYEKPFLRRNISKGAFQSVEHYLDVQFRLLREDFIAPLREGIQFYKKMIIDQQQNQLKKKKNNNIRIYRDVEFELKGEFVQDKCGCLVNFDKKQKLKVNWEMAKRFMYGSLLVFTINEFQTFFLGVVLERKIELLKQGKLIVELLEDTKPLFNTTLTMVESEVFFEPYKCSMEVLKTINSHNFPMEKYIISASREIDYPFYIDAVTDQSYYSIDNLKKFRVLFHNEWPEKEQLGLDEMQYRAFKAALTHEFAIIQGPPGTGKTFIGLKIMKTLISNLYTKADNSKSSDTQQYLNKPILVVCYTNHALDQFMEGILTFTNQVVRIGGQTKSEIIQKFSLKNITRWHRKSITTNRGLSNIGDRLKTIMHNIQYLKKCSEIVSHNDGILELSLLKNGMPKKYHNLFKSSSDLLSWLFEDLWQYNIDPVAFLSTISYELINTVFHSENMLKNKCNLIEEEEEEEYINGCRDAEYEADDPDLEYNFNSDIVIYTITLNDVKQACHKLLSEIMRLEEQLNLDFNVNIYNDCEEVKFNFDVMEKIHDYFSAMLNLDYAFVDLPEFITDLNELKMNERWALYFHWVKTAKEMFNPSIMDNEQKYKRVYKQYAELRDLENIEILNKMHVIALTTTGAAKHRTMLEGLESPIVVVEEAAEVLEAHIISSLTRHIQHLILIGDHKQLRPSNAVYKLAKEYNFDISLFERMVNNNVPCYTLGEQHRMRPEIASLVAPIIYPELKNHYSVESREDIRGVVKSLFFLNHNEYEKEVEEISSKSNDHEATFLIMFARHLILQGYKTSQVTILTTYSGQLFKLRSLRKQHSLLEGLRITVVDNYQGEENDIILLSLVRSNVKGNVGFLKTENRICVALSRAKYGLYIMGNMGNLLNSGNLWKQIKETLDNQGSYGDELTLECAIHYGKMTKVSKAEDFKMIMEGGCTLLCKSLLQCGHYCASVCHSYDREHKQIKCREPCNRSCDEYNHPCMKPCFMNCEKCTVLVLKELPCSHRAILPCFVDSITFPCEEEVEVVLEDCGHKVIKKCHVKKPKCTFKCFDRLNCGHACELNCHKNEDPDHEIYKCNKPCENINKNCSLNHKCQKLCFEDCSSCTKKIKKILACGHVKNNVPCELNDSEIKCYAKCERLLKCNHRCLAKCYEPCKPCKEEVKKTIPYCGHSVKIMCKIEPERKHCTQICERTLDCGHKCKNICAELCTNKKCEEIIFLKFSPLACGHNKVWVLCCDKYKEYSMDSQYLLDKCREPCLQKLKCDDVCQSTCGQCKQGRLHLPCKETCNKINPCNHICKFPCKERCPPCNKNCLYSCVHSKCTQKCGVPCQPCKEKCDWQCPHLTCTKLCGGICNREPCYEPCNLELQCGHECIGFCGEPCPPLCRICQNDEVTSIVFGNEDEPDARFVYLEDCKHTIESKALEQWMKQNDEEIALKQCPLCKTPILKTQRFMNHVKIIIKDITEIKKKQYGELSVIRSYMKQVLDSLKSLDDKFDVHFVGNMDEFYHIKELWDKFYQPLCKEIKIKKKNKSVFYLPAQDIESLSYVKDLFKSTSKYKKQVKDLKDGQKQNTVINHFVWLLSVAFTYARQLSNQQKYDINMEMLRGDRIISLFKITANDEFKMAVGMQTSLSKELNDFVGHMEALLMSCKIYTDRTDKDIQHLTELINQKIKSVSIITDKERRMIHEAMSRNFHGGSRSQGHWCKCSNGHIYCITECGGPMQKANCPECKVEIGGENHRYVSGTTVAFEMDGARNLSWSSGNNMANYDFE